MGFDDRRKDAVSRRGFVGRGLAALGGAAMFGAMGHRSAFGGRIIGPPCDTGAAPLDLSRPILPIAGPHPDTRLVYGIPIRPWFQGDSFATDQIPFHSPENYFGMPGPPAPTETVRVAVVGGGMSGLSTAYWLRRYNPVVFELYGQFGGNARGANWGGSRYSFGGAYVITPDPGTFFHTLYHHLGLHQVVRVDRADASIELEGKIIEDFWSGAGLSPEDTAAFEAYGALVDYMANVAYPDVPFDQPWMIELDKRTLKADIEMAIGGPMPTTLASAVQSYCYSSFGAGMEEVSAASGWNFLAAEEFGRWVFPGGNSYMVDALWRKLHALERDTPAGCDARHLRASCRVVDIRPHPGGMVQLTYKDRDLSFRSILAEKVVVACSKHICKHLFPDLDVVDPDKYAAMNSIAYRAYVVGNVILDRAIDPEFYDIFLLGDGVYPGSAPEATAWSRVTDVVDGSFARVRNEPGIGDVLTLYWPLPFDTARFLLTLDNPWKTFGVRLAGDVHRILKMLGLPVSSVREVQMARWGHALPVAEPWFIASGNPGHLLRPIDDRIYFVNQDNWALPAVENSLFDARNVAEAISSSL